MLKTKTIQFFSKPFLPIDLRDFQCDEVMIGGDFNLVLDIDKDKKGSRYKTRSKSAKLLNEISADLDLVDAWRALNPDTRKYT